MPSNKYTDDVNLMEFADRKQKRRDGRSALKLTATELKERRLGDPRHLKYYRPEQMPEKVATTIRKRVCPVCNYSNGRLMATCYRCRLCYACGSYAGESKDDNCNVCANFNTATPPEKPIIEL